jgi:hypothetical protein
MDNLYFSKTLTGLMQTFIKETDLNHIDIPSIVYKYRCWNDAHPKHKTILTEQEVYFSSPKDFDDPMDCKNLTRYDLLTKSDIFEKYLLDSRGRNKEFTPDQHEAFARFYADRSPLQDKIFVRRKMENDFEVLCSRLGILSLTERLDLPEMWDKYAEGSTGICVGFDARKVFEFFGGGGRVNYYEKLPVIFPRPKHSFEEQLTLQVYSKEVKWDFEREYRTLKLFPKIATIGDRIIKLPPKSIIEVVVGAFMSTTAIGELRQLIAESLPHVRLRRVVRNADGQIVIEDM